MAAHSGQLTEINLVEKDFTDPRPFEQFEIQTGLGSVADGIFTPYPENLSGLFSLNIWYNLAYNKIYLSPISIDVGLIGNDTEHFLTFWNAGEIEKNLIQIVASNSEGYTLDIPPLPVLFTAETIKEYTLTVLKDGPATQNTEFEFKFDTGESLFLTLTGIRLEVFPFECDATEGVEVIFKHQTVVAQSNKFLEQRRGLYEKELLSISASFWLDSDRPTRNQNLLNRAKAFSDLILAVPVWIEEFKLVNDPFGSTFLQIVEDLSGRFFLTRCKYVLILDLLNALHYELIERGMVDEIGGKINLLSSVSGSFLTSQSSVFPVLVSFCPEVQSFEQLTPKIAKYSLTFEEFLE